MLQDDNMSIGSDYSSKTSIHTPKRRKTYSDDEDDQEDDVQHWSQQTDLSALSHSVIDDSSRMSTGSSNHSRVQEQDDSSLPPSLSQLGRVLSQKLPNGSFLRYQIERDVHAELADAEQQRVALEKNMEIAEVRAIYKRQTLIFHTQHHRGLQKQRAKHSEYEGLIAAYCQKLQKETYPIIIAKTATLKEIRIPSTDYWHTEMLPRLASDLDKGILSTLVERPKIETDGVRLCVRLRYCTFVELNESAQERHLRIAADLAMECFPNQDPACYTMYVAASTTGKIIHHRHRPQECLHMCSYSFQLIWPAMPVIRQSRFLRLFWMALDLRIRKQDAFYANVVDHRVYHPKDNTARLQALYAHKSTPCIPCRDFANDGGNVEEIGDYESSMDDDNEDMYRGRSEAGLCDCTKGKKIAPYSYDLHEIFRRDEQNTQWEIEQTNFNESKGEREVSTLEKLRNMSIVPSRENRICPDIVFHIPSDSPDLHDTSVAIQDSPKVFEHNEQKTLQRHRSSELVDRQQHPEVYTLCDNVIRLVSPPIYTDLVSQRVTLQHKSKMIFVDVQGRNRRYCFLHGGEHPKGIYFIIQPLRNIVSAYCYDPKCKQILKLRSQQRMRDREQQRFSRKNAVLPQLQQQYQDTITPEQETALANMEAPISLDSGFRESLFQLIGVPYRGKTRSVATLVGDADLAARKNQDQANASDYFDETFGLYLPRQIAFQSFEVKKQFLASQPIVPCAKIIAGSDVVPFVSPVAAKHLESYLTLKPSTPQERAAAYRNNRATRDVLL